MLHTATSAAEPSRCIQEGDLVVVYEGFDSLKSARVTANGYYNNKFGSFAHADWLGKPFGSRATARKGGGWILLLAPTPELWTSVLRHRTQILYVADIAMVCAMLELRPGAVVLESGTGSGSLTHSLARAVGPTGQVWTYEFHEQRAKMAAEEFKANGLGGIVTVTQRDIEESGFPERHHGQADGLFLDLPKPYKVVPSAARCVRPDGMFCSFSPCIEQVQRTCEALNAHGFRDIRTMEVLLRSHEVSRAQLQTDMEAAPAAPTSKRQARQQQQGRGAKRPRTEGGGEGEAAGPAGEAGAGAPAAAEGAGSDEAPAAAAAGGEALEAVAPADGQQKQQTRQVVSKPVPFGRGHTGYLTFARRVVSP
ncbi:hypothetical protein ABPG77_008768 [Micractinium sp. CCAP 211/92]